MDIFKDGEVVFTDSFAKKTLRTLTINTNAPLHYTTANVPPSSGLSSFPPESRFCDRFIVWRAVGPKLYMEERSICFTVTHATLCLDFQKAAILPGTSITVINQATLCIVVPTQSAVHRFYLKTLVYFTHQSSIEVPSMFFNINDQEFLNDNHTSHSLITTGHALRASVLLLKDTTKIAYCMTDGQLVIVTMPNSGNIKCEETVLQGRGLFKKILGLGNECGIADVTGLLNEIGPQPAGSPGDVFYAVYKDGLVRAWNTETQVSHTYQLKIPDNAQIIAFGIKSYRLGEDEKYSIVFVSISTTLGIVFCALRDHNRKLTLMNTVSAENHETLLDFGVSNSTKEENAVRLYAMWSSASATGYTVKHVTFVLTNTVEQKAMNIKWRTVMPVAPKDSISTRMDSDVAKLREEVFSLDAYPYHVVYRATRVICQGMGCERSIYNWATLAYRIDKFLMSTEFYEKYWVGKNAIKSTTNDPQTKAEKKFFLALLSACDEFDSAGKTPLGLAILDIPGASWAGVIQQDRFSVIHEVDHDLLKLLTLIEPDLMERIIMEARQMQKVTMANISSDSDEEKGLGVGRTQPGLLGFLTINQLSAKHKWQWLKLMKSYVDISAWKEVEASANSSKCWFNGSFTTGLISASLKHVLKQRLKFSDDLLLVNSMMNRDENAKIEDLSIRKRIEHRLQFLRSHTQQVLSVLDIKFSQEFAQVSLGSWLFSDEGLAMIRCEGRADETEANHQHQSQFNEFVESTVQAALCILWPSSHCLYLARKLAQHEKYDVLKNLCSVARYSQEDLYPAYQYYLGIAYSGLGEPQHAIFYFNEAVRGVLDNNLALQHALRSIGKHNRTTSQNSSSLLENRENLLGEFYLQAMQYLVNHNHSEQVIELAKSAIIILPERSEIKSHIYINLFNYLVATERWEDALISIHQNKDQSVRKLALVELLSRMLDAKQWDMITLLQFGDLEDLVIATLLEKARVQEVSATPHLFELISAFHVQQDHNYEKAAIAIYEYAFLLRTHSNQTPDLLRKRRDALLCASSLLSLLPEEDRFLTLPQQLQFDGGEGPLIRSKVCILTHAELLDEFVLTNARVTC